MSAEHRTRCPFCHTLFRVTDDQLAQAAGQVRCGSCNSVFDGAEFRVPDEPDLLADRATWSAPAGEPESGREAVPAVELPTSESVADRPFDVSSPEPESDAEAPFQVAAPPHRGDRMVGLLKGVAGLLALILLLQLLHYYANPLAQRSEGLRWMLEPYCGVTGCHIDPRRDIHAFRVVSRDIRSHPNVAHALVISATMINTATFAQPYPVFEISLTDVHGSIVATRLFMPREYLEDPDQAVALMPAQLPVRVTMEVFDPGEHAVGFEFAFH